MAMDKSAADSYVYAKASGMLARSYVGERARQLFSFHTLSVLSLLKSFINAIVHNFPNESTGNA